MIQPIGYEAPSNIALVKYWGKYDIQKPCNPSISFTLDHCKSIFEIEVFEKKNKEISINLIFEGKENPIFAQKIKTFFSKIEQTYPMINTLDWYIKSSNTFPHSSGIASSASSMAALAMCLEQIQYQFVDINRASSTARIGSGSASRSIIPQIAWWGYNRFMPNSSESYAIPCVENIDAIFLTFQNAILIAHSGQKTVSSSLGHDLMNKNPFASTRYLLAHNNALQLHSAMREGDLDTFIQIVEEEAMMLHGLMMMSHPSFILMKPNTLTMIDKIRNYRLETKSPLCFTLDAGPNIHLLYPESIQTSIKSFIESELKPLCENNQIIYDKVGFGPKKIH